MAGPANKQGRFIADRMFGREIINKGYLGTGIGRLFGMNVASTGAREKDLVNSDVDYQVVYTAPPGIVGIMPNNHLVFSKLIFDKKDGKVLGAQFCSSGAADKRADVIATAIKFGATIYDLVDLELAYAPPFGTGKDVVNKTGYVATNLHQGLFKQVTFQDVYDLIQDGAQVIDVREGCEYDGGSIEGAVNIPMSQLRDRLDEIDKTKPVYVHCRTGERSYNMTLMLQANGFDVFNIAGSWEFTRTYEEAMCILDENRKNIIK
jgi:rhodanese-related sulfurtransferase